MTCWCGEPSAPDGANWTVPGEQGRLCADHDAPVKRHIELITEDAPSAGTTSPGR